MGQKSLSDLVRGLRAWKGQESVFITTALADIRKELKEPSTATKAVALSKLSLLHMMGHDMSWASFHIVEVAASPRFSHKRAAYFAAALALVTPAKTEGECVLALFARLSSVYLRVVHIVLGGWGGSHVPIPPGRCARGRGDPGSALMACGPRAAPYALYGAIFVDFAPATGRGGGEPQIDPRLAVPLYARRR